MVTVILIVLMVSVSLLALRWISQFEEGECFDRLYEETGRLARSIERNTVSYAEKLEVMAALAAEAGDLSDPEFWEALDSSSMTEGITHLAILLPDNSILTAEGRQPAGQNGLSFEQEAALGTHISDRETDEAGRYVIRHYAPVIKNGETIAMLFCTIDLHSLSEKMKAFAYGGQGAVYIIDGNNGEFLMDTWHKDLGNIWSLGERKMAPGYNHEQLKQGLSDGERNYVVFVSETTGKYLYFYYEPLQINNWRIAVSVPENVVFSSVNNTRRILIGFLVFEIVCFLLYFLWILHYSRHEANEKQRQLDSLNYIYEVEKLLFNAHEKRDNIDLALEKIGYITSAQRVSLWSTNLQENVSFVWNEPGNRLPQSDRDDRRLIDGLKTYFSLGNSELEAESADVLKAKLPGMPPDGVKNLLAVPVTDVDGTLCGILVSYNQGHRQMSTLALKSVSFSFSMFFHNLFLYNTLKEQSEKDSLTGLQNRNRYERDLQELRQIYRHSLSCIYVDVNGLHELNNTEGHEAGDRMLCAVANQLLKCFGEQHTYRIGGDEFLVFSPDIEKEEMERLCRELTDTLEREKIHVSVGVEWKTGDFSITDLIKTAEKKMYAAKRAFYTDNAEDRRQQRRIP